MFGSSSAASSDGTGQEKAVGRPFGSATTAVKCPCFVIGCICHVADKCFYSFNDPRGRQRRRGQLRDRDHGDNRRFHDYRNQQRYLQNSLSNNNSNNMDCSNLHYWSREGQGGNHVPPGPTSRILQNFGDLTIIDQMRQVMTFLWTASGLRPKWSSEAPYLAPKKKSPIMA